MITVAAIRTAIANCVAQASADAPTDAELRVTAFVARLSGSMESLGDHELDAMLWVSGSILTSTFDSMSELLTHNAHHRNREKGVVVMIRNTGTVDVSVEDVSLIYELETPTPGVRGAEFTLMGRNDYLQLQSVPHRLLAGDSFKWLTKASTLVQCQRAAAVVDKQYSSLIARVRLATGETIESPEVPWSSVSALLTSDQDDIQTPRD